MAVLTIADVLAWLKSLGAPSGVDGWTMARLDASKERRVGVYQRPTYDGAEVALGGQAQTKTRTKHVQVLVHWTKNARDTEEAAQALYDAIAAADHPTIGDFAAAYIDPMLPEPVDLGADDSGIFERAIWLDIYYQNATNITEQESING